MDKNARKPADAMSKHLTNAEKARRKAEEGLTVTGKEALCTPPDWLVNVRAVTEWKRITGELLKLEIIGNLDADALACYCNALAAYIETTKELAGQPIIIEKPMANGSVQKVLNPLYTAQQHHATEMRRFGALCGITLDSRLKAASIKVSEQENELEKEFGVI